MPQSSARGVKESAGCYQGVNDRSCPVLSCRPMASPDRTPTLADWLTAIGTISTAALALLLATRDQLQRWLFQPRLRLKIKQGSPDCTTIEAKGVMQTPKGIVPFQETQFYCRFSVDNDGRRRANDVAVRLIRLWRQEKAAWVEDESFFPLFLKWSHVGLTVTPALDPRLPRHCDFCHCTENEHDRFHLETEVEPYEVSPGVFPTVKPPGTYRFHAAVTAANAPAQYAIVELTFDGQWSDDTTEMATHHLAPNVLRQGGKPYDKPE